MKKQKRTNFSEKLVDLILKTILPISLAVALVTGENLPSLTKTLIRTSSFITSPTDTVKVFRKKPDSKNLPNGAQLDDNLNQNSDSISASSTLHPDVPSDVLNLIKEAEIKYANSSNDGIITEVNYSGKNATSEYDGVFIRNTTKSHSVDIEEHLNKKIIASVDKNEPTVLIYHTHTTETYELLDRGFYTAERGTRSTNPAENMIRVGEEICKTLQKNGYKTIHDKTIYDEQYSGAYDRSRKNVIEILKNNPSIQIVIDVHRDSIYQKDGEKIKPVVNINGRKAAQIMLISGCEEGNVTDFPNWEMNLTFAVHLQKQLAKDNPELMRPIMFCSRKYNMDLIPCALVAEFGSDANTLAEAVYSAQLFGESLSALLKEKLK